MANDLRTYGEDTTNTLALISFFVRPDFSGYAICFHWDERVRPMSGIWVRLTLLILLRPEPYPYGDGFGKG
jgi:hypothetical protein